MKLWTIFVWVLSSHSLPDAVAPAHHLMKGCFPDSSSHYSLTIHLLLIATYLTAFVLQQLHFLIHDLGSSFIIHLRLLVLLRPARTLDSRLVSVLTPFLLELHYESEFFQSLLMKHETVSAMAFPQCNAYYKNWLHE